jgi:uncharacterized protein YjlB
MPTLEGPKGYAERATGLRAVLPAGTGHQCLSADEEFPIIGAYPPNGYGPGGPLPKLWKPAK